MKLLAQIIGVLAVATYLLSYQFKKRKHITMVNATSSSLYVLQYVLLGAYEGAVLDVISAFSTIIAHNTDKGFVAKYAKYIFIFVNLLFIISGILLYKNIYSLFPAVGAILQTSSFWLSKERYIRLVSFIGAPFWLVYNIVVESYGPAFGSILSIFSIGIAIFRYDIYPFIKKGGQKDE